MYELRMNKNGEWTLLIHGGKATYTGTFKSIIKMMVQQYKFDLGQLDMAVQELCRNETLHRHDTAHFGIYRTLIYTYNSKAEEKKAV